MSLNAFVWASNLPPEIVSATAFRALLKYADRVDEQGRAAWYTAEGLAETLGCSKRTAQRAVKELRDRGLLVEGDQRFVKHIPANYRPTVFDINMRPNLAPRLDLEGVTTGVTPDASRGDRFGPPGVTTAVALRTVIEPYRSSTNVSTDRGDKSVTSGSRTTVAPAPSLPRLADVGNVPRIARRIRSADELAELAQLEAEPCPASAGFTHWFPADMTECARGCTTTLTTTERSTP